MRQRQRCPGWEIRRCRAWFLGLLVLSGGCDAAPESGPQAFTGWDSAGVRIAESREAAWADDEAWRIENEPVLQIGLVEGEEPYQFSSIWAAAQHPDGRIAVAEGRVSEIRIFGADGTHLQTIGRRGRGPGEFREGPFVSWVLPDTLLAWDPSARRLSWFDNRGVLVREHTIAEELSRHSLHPVSGSPVGWHLASDGSLLSRGYLMERIGEQSHARSPLHLITRDENGVSVAELGEYGFEQFASTTTTMAVRNPFTHWSSSTLRDEPLAAFVAGTEEWEIRGFSPEGRLTQLLRAAVPRTPLSQDMVEAERSPWRTRAMETDIPPSTFLGPFNEFEVPDSLPAIVSLHADKAGNLWVGRRSSVERVESELDILDREGRWLGTVRLPSEVDRVFEIGSDRVLARWMDELDVPYLRVYRIQKN